MEDVSSDVEQTLKMEVEIEGVPKPSVQFYKDGKVVKESENIKITEDGEKHVIIIKNTTLKDSGGFCYQIN